MDRAFYSGAVSTPPSPPVAVSIGFPVNIGPQDTTTLVGDYWFYMATEEIRNVILMGNVVPDHLQVNQMALAIQNAIAAAGSSKANSSHTHPISDVVNLQPILDAWATHTHSSLINGAGTAVLSNTGDLTVSGNVSGFSDIRLKTDIQVIEDALAKVNKIRGVTFTRKDLPDSKRMIGVIAQEVQAVQPELVQEDAEGRLSVAYGNMVGLLIEAVKELSAEVELLKEGKYR